MSKEIKEFFITKMEEKITGALFIGDFRILITTREFQNMYDEIIFQSRGQFYGTDRGAFRHISP